MYTVRLIKELAEKKAQIEKELSKGNRTNEIEHRLLVRGIEQLKQNYKAGKRISKRNQKPYRFYSKKYGVTNLWKLDVSKDWRMVYSIVGNEIEVISFILDIMDHKKYERRFGY